jgi:uncharacterized membrane protein
MIAALVASLILNAQPAGAPAPLVVELCNATPARVAYSIVYPGRAGVDRRRGWLTVEPGDCLEGAIGTTVGGRAYVHAMSGEFRWPGRGSDRASCLPATAHDDPAVSPPCAGGTRQSAFQAVPIEARRRQYRLSYRVSCSGLSVSDQDWCRTGRRGAQGFAEAVRTLEVCNATSLDVRLAIAAEAPNGRDRQIKGWLPLGAGGCIDAWRGLTGEGVVYVHAAGGAPMNHESGLARYCVPSGTDFERRASWSGDASCEEGARLVSFRPVRFGENVSHMTLDLQG